MAIDTAAKRRSALDFEEVWAEAIPAPDGNIKTTDRRHLLWSFVVYPVIWDGVYLVYDSSQGQTIRAVDYTDLSAVVSHEHGHVSNLEGYGVTITLPTPGVEITMNQPGVTLTIDEIRGWYELEDGSGAWAFESGYAVSGG